MNKTIQSPVDLQNPSGFAFEEATAASLGFDPRLVNANKDVDKFKKEEDEHKK